MQCFPLYSILAAIGNPVVDYLSLDIEGAELQVSKAMLQLFWFPSPQINSKNDWLPTYISIRGEANKRLTRALRKKK